MTLKDGSTVLAVSTHGVISGNTKTRKSLMVFGDTGIYDLYVDDLVGTPAPTPMTAICSYLKAPISTRTLIMLEKRDPAGVVRQPKLQGGRTFEPDDLATKIEDNFPDCDGIPGSGDEGDAGIFEKCNSFQDFGYKDGPCNTRRWTIKASWTMANSLWASPPISEPPLIPSEHCSSAGPRQLAHVHQLRFQNLHAGNPGWERRADVEPRQCH